VSSGGEREIGGQSEANDQWLGKTIGLDDRMGQGVVVLYPLGSLHPIEHKGHVGTYRLVIEEIHPFLWYHRNASTNSIA
jgi:hypothetical protein